MNVDSVSHCAVCCPPQKIPRPALLKGSSNGAVVVEGFSEKSVLIRKLASRSMPPPGTGQPLGDDQIQGIRKWVDKGHFVDHTEFQESTDRGFTKAEAPEITAKDREFWAFRKTVAEAVPHVKAAKRVRTPIDAFVLSKLEAKGLTMPPEASQRSQLRRAYFDLLGITHPRLVDKQSWITARTSARFGLFAGRSIVSSAPPTTFCLEKNDIRHFRLT
jgi:hypothetical protein